MSGGGKKKNETPAAGTPSPTQATATVQPFMPGMDQMLAQQLSAGFGGNPQDFLTAFMQTYQPMQVPTQSVYMGGQNKPPADSKSSDKSVDKNGKTVFPHGAA